MKLLIVVRVVTLLGVMDPNDMTLTLGVSQHCWEGGGTILLFLDNGFVFLGVPCLEKLPCVDKGIPFISNMLLALHLLNPCEAWEFQFRRAWRRLSAALVSVVGINAGSIYFGLLYMTAVFHETPGDVAA